jgi:hypothetical protein
MAATLLNSEQAVELSVFVVRPFVRLRETLASNKELAGRIEEFKKYLETHAGEIQEKVIKRRMNPPPSRRGKIGFPLPTAQTG